MYGEEEKRKNRLALITGGARSGKSAFAGELARRTGKQVVYIATCLPDDEEMEERIQEHRRRRPATWLTLEEPFDVAGALVRWDGPDRCFLVDCLTVLLSNHLLRRVGPEGERLGKRTQPVREEVFQEMAHLARVARGREAEVLVVSNEVGMGLVPEWPLGRVFRDLAGQVNQLFAMLADEVYLLVSGIPFPLK